MQLRQGDVFLEKVDAVPANAKPIPGPIVVAHGESTGHAHRIMATNRIAKFLEAPDGRRFLEVKWTVKLEHEEHTAIVIEPGIYRVQRQVEYRPGEIRQVAD